jgi:hypothetical protein
MMVTMNPPSIPPVLNPPPPGPPPPSPPAKTPKRHGCLLVWLLLMLLVEATSVLGEISLKAISGHVDLSSITKIAPESSLYTWGIVVLASADIICVIFLFQWKKWAFYGSALVGVGVMVLTLIANGSLSGVMALVLPGVLYGVLQIGGENSGWRRLQ